MAIANIIPWCIDIWMAKPRFSDKFSERNIVIDIIIVFLYVIESYNL